jgi:hypothetical protein
VRLQIQGDKVWTGEELRTNADQAVNWEREDRSGSFVRIVEAETYLLTANDIGSRLRVTWQRHQSEPTQKCVIRPDIRGCVHAFVRAKAFKFVGQAKVGKLKWLVSVDASGISMTAKGMPEKSAKWGNIRTEAMDGTTDEMRIWFDSSTKFVVIPSIADDPRLAKSVGRHARDLIVAALAEFAQRESTE